MAEIVQEMRLFSGQGERLYLTAGERGRFLDAALDEDRENRVFCSVLHFTGARPSEVLEITPDRISLGEKVIVLRTLKNVNTINKAISNCHSIDLFQSPIN